MTLIPCKFCGEAFKSRNIRQIYCKNCTKERKRDRSRRYTHEMREVARDIGNCTQCFKPKDDPRYAMCKKCRDAHKKNAKQK